MKHTMKTFFLLLMTMRSPLIALICCRVNIFRINIMGVTRPVMVGVALLVAPVATFAQDVNQDCTLIVPNNPLTATGLATPYQLKATNPADGPCHEADTNQSAFVQAAVIDLDNGQISVYNPLVVDMDTTPAVPPVLPILPARHVVALWFGFNGSNLKLVMPSRHADDLRDNHCTQGFGQFAYCNAVEFFERANHFIQNKRLIVPPLGRDQTANHEVCPTVRSFFVVDQDQSDNVTTVYLFTTDGKVAQNTAANRATLAGSLARGNPSDNRLLDVFIDGALGCIPWTVPDLADPGALVPALPLNELQAKVFQAPPIAQIPLGNPFAFSPAITGVPSLRQVNLYRRGVDQEQANPIEASTTTYCHHMQSVQPRKMFRDKPALVAFRSPDPAVADTLFTFMAQRYVASYEILKCQALLNKPVNVTLRKSEAGIVIDARLIH